MAKDISNILSSGENVRAGSTSRECTKEELARLFQRSRQVNFEETPVHEANENHLDRYKIQEYFQSVDEYNLDQDDPNNYKFLLKIRK